MGIIKSGAKLAGKMIKMTPAGTGDISSNILVPVPTKLGLGAIIGTGIVGSINSGYDNMEQHSLGNIDNTVINATPYVDAKKKYSVDGSLAFALRNNRFG